jgi:hypothetical protein
MLLAASNLGRVRDILLEPRETQKGGIDGGRRPG